MTKRFLTKQRCLFFFFFTSLNRTWQLVGIRPFGFGRKLVLSPQYNYVCELLLVFQLIKNGKAPGVVACSRRSDSGARAKEPGKNEGSFRSPSFSLVLHYLNAWNRLLGWMITRSPFRSMALNEGGPCTVEVLHSLLNLIGRKKLFHMTGRSMF